MTARQLTPQQLQEIRALLAEIPSERLVQYSDECLEEGFTGSGLALQDIINEVGRRLGFDVVNGRYRGKSGAIGNDGLWELPNKHKFVLEVKTTDAYRIDLNTIADYRRELLYLLRPVLCQGRASALRWLRTSPGHMAAK